MSLPLLNWTLGIIFIFDMYSSLLDHGNEWCAREPTKDVIFCFDKHSGWVKLFFLENAFRVLSRDGRYGGYGKHSWGYGVRNLKFHTPDPKSGVETWIRLQKGETRARVILDDKYGR